MNSNSEIPTSLIQRIHDCDAKAVVSVAGAGTAAISWMLGVAGASRTVLEITVPYASTALTEFVGHEPAQFVSAETAAEMAQAAYRRALRLREDAGPVVGVACTATIATDRTKRGEHRCHVAAWSAKGVSTYSLTFTKGLRDRSGEDEIASKLILRAIADSAGVEFDADIRLAPPEQVKISAVCYGDPIEALMAGHIEQVVVHADGRMRSDEPFTGGILSGSFNPLHEGHTALVDTASRLLGKQVAYELSVVNVDKPPLQKDEVRSRAAQFAGKSSIVLTRVPVFYEKARLLPGCVFIIGVDTAVRLFDPRYYGGSMSKMLMALEEMRQADCRFLVAGRSNGGKFLNLADVVIPEGFESMFTPIPEAEFRSDTSSTQIRQGRRTVSV